jgi:hypothetical protein
MQSVWLNQGSRPIYDGDMCCVAVLLSSVGRAWRAEWLGLSGFRGGNRVLRNAVVLIISVNSSTNFRTRSK